MNNIKKIFKLLIVICIGYTFVSLLNAGLSMLNGYETISARNEFAIILWCSIAASVLFTHNLFSRFSPITTMLIQYAIALSAIMIDIYISGRFIELHPDAYKDGFISFTIFFIIGGSIYYFYVFNEAKKENSLLQEIKKQITNK